ncbi:M23 family metallopeptidase [Burkholderia sp. 22PA0099]|uniref:M23 family metallopeptidase n=1 Tax=Burkholderia sp. 22PA0099 TaxID=3237372 RepID=UPI0039C0D372
MWSPLSPISDVSAIAGAPVTPRPARVHAFARLMPAACALGALATVSLVATLPAISQPVSPTALRAAGTPQHVFAATPFPSAQRFVTDQLEAAIAARGTPPGQFASRFASGSTLLGDATDAFSLDTPARAFGAAPLATGLRVGVVEHTFSQTLRQLDMPPEIRIQVGDLIPVQMRTHAPALTGDRYRVGWVSTPQGPQLTALDVRIAGRKFSAMWFQPPGAAHGAFYTFDGTPLEAAALTMPVIATRISSPFGVRIHPISHLRLFHTGVDLAAPRGTRVNAAADGVVAFVGTDPHGYGRYVVVDHPDRTSTLYAHLSAWAPGLKAGMQVAQGQRLGAVGMTGAATGPHLHFEVRLADAQPVDPIVALADASNRLSPMQLDAFRRNVTDLRTQFAAAAAGPAVGIAMLGGMPAGAGLGTPAPALQMLPAPHAGAAS